MKKILILTLSILSMFIATKAQAIECVTVAKENGQSLQKCVIEGKTINFLDVQGSMNDLAYYHGKFLSKEIKVGVLSSVIERRDEALAALGGSERRQFEAIYKCMMKKYKKSVSKNFLTELEYLAKGSRDANTPLSSKDVIEGTFMIELSGFIDALNVEFDSNKRATNWKLVKSCGGYLAGGVIKGIFSKIARPFKKFKKGCTGFVAPSSLTENGEHLHGRNFDTGFLGVFEKYPVVVRHRNSQGYNYVGMTSAGLHYPGGISGMNEKGISISTHELRTVDYKMKYRNRVGQVAPYAANLVLSKAASIDEAVKLLKSYGFFGAWSFLISDSKTGESVSVEMGGDKVRVAKRTRQEGMGQSNHFIHKDTRDSNFEYSINKSLESRARLSLVEESLSNSKGEINAQWGIDLLSGHTDYLMGLRSFGRTVSKVYTSMTHIMDTKNNTFWFSVGESYPTNLSTFIGLNVMFDGDENFFEFTNTKSSILNEEVELSNWKKSLTKFTESFLIFDHSRNEEEKLKQSYGLLNEAIELSNLDGVYEFPYEILKVRLGMQLMTRFSNSVESDELFSSLFELEKRVMDYHDYEQSQIYADLAKLYDLTGNRELAMSYFSKSVKALENLREEYPSHFFLNKLYWTLTWFTKHPYSKYDYFTEEIHYATAE